MDTAKVFLNNRASTQRLQHLLQRLTEAQSQSVMPNGWTVNVTLAHLAFWDQRVIRVIEMAKKEGRVIRTELDIQLNDIIEPFLKAIPSAETARLALSSAETLDQLLETASPELLAQLEKESPRWVDRSLHRNDHLDDIEKHLNH